MMISVIIPCFNRESSIRAAVLSVLSQSTDKYKVEVIVVDDGSTDNSLAELSDLNVKVFSTGGRKGACAARNIGIRESKGTWIAFNDSDDYWRADKLKKITDIIDKSKYNIEYLVHSFLRGDKSKFSIGGILRGGDQVLESESTLSMLLKKNFVSTQCLIVKKETIEKVGLFDEELMRFQDWELAIRLSEKSRGYYLDDALSICIETIGSISTGYQKGIQARKYIYRKHKYYYDKDAFSKLKFFIDLKIRGAFSHLKKIGGSR